ncbi:MAG: HAD-IA family hydrolase [Candidatus Omnitrophica bacterium]|nr:HAD-IA family hydrolase [Candidatus Omnitrophota bacterium]
MDLGYANTETLLKRTNTLAAPSMFVNKLNLPVDFWSEIPLQERAEIGLFFEYIQRYFFNVQESIAKKRENYVASVIRKELECKGIQVPKGIVIDSIRFENGIVSIPYVREGGIISLKISCYDTWYEYDLKKRIIEDNEISNGGKDSKPEIDLLLKKTLDVNLTEKERNASLYELIFMYLNLKTDASKEEFLKQIKEENIRGRIVNNVLGQIQSFTETVENVMSKSISQAKEWAARVQQNPIPRVLMLIAGPTVGCGSGVVVEALAAEHQRKGGSLAISLANGKPITHKDLKLDDTALVNTIIFGKSDTADSELVIPVYSKGMALNLPRYKDMKKRDLIEFLEVYYKRLKMLIDEYQPDIIHTNHLFLLNPLVQLIAPWIPAISTTHGNEQKMLREDGSMIGLVAPAAKRLDKVLTISPDMSEDTKSVYGLTDKKLKLVRNGFDPRIYYPQDVDKNEFLRGYGIEGDYDKVVLYAGRFVSYKKLDYLLEAAALYSKGTDEKILTLLVGPGAEDVVNQYQEFIEKHNLKDSIKILDRGVSHEEVAKFLNIADVFALPSDNEPFSLITLEALACGSKVIAANCGGPQMLVSQDLLAQKLAVLIDPLIPDDEVRTLGKSLNKTYVEALSEGIKVLLNNDGDVEQRRRISETIQEYSWETIYGRVAEIYRDVIERRVRRYSPKPRADSLPNISKQVKVVEVHPTNKCNLSCFKCPYGALHRDGATFPFEDISKITDLRPEKIFVLGGGEPSVYSWKGYDINDFMRELRLQNPEATISLCTNGIIYLAGQIQQDINILRVSTHGLKGKHFQNHEEKMPKYVDKIWKNIWMYFEKGAVQEQWTTFLFDRSNVLDSIVIAEELWKKWNQLCEENSELRKKKFGFKLIYLADDDSLESPFHLSNPDEKTIKRWSESISEIKKSGRPFGEFLNNYEVNGLKADGFVLPREIAEAMLPIRESPKVNRCMLAKDHALIGADGNIYPCRVQAAIAAHSYGKVLNTTVDELARQRSKLYEKCPPECSKGCRLMHTIIAQTTKQYEMDEKIDHPLFNEPMKQNKKLLIFDLDGTFYKSKKYEIHERGVAIKWIASQLGKTNEEIMNLWPWKEHRPYVDFLEEYGLDLRGFCAAKAENIDLTNLPSSQDDEHKQHLREVLIRLSNKYHLAMVTNNGEEVAHKILGALGIDDLFEVVVGADTYLSQKPNTLMFQAVINHFALTPDQVVSIGDNPKYDVDPIEKLGGDGVLVKNGPIDIINELEKAIAVIEEKASQKAKHGEVTSPVGNDEDGEELIENIKREPSVFMKKDEKEVRRVESSGVYLNNSRAKVVRAYNEVATDSTIQVEDDTESIVLSVMGLIEEREEEQEIKEQIETMKSNVGRLYVDSIISSAIVKARAAKTMDQKVVIGLDQSWIPGMQKGDWQNQTMRPLLRELLRLEDTLRGLGIENVKVVVSEGDELAGEVLSAMNVEDGSSLNDTTFDNVIILAAKEVVEAESFGVIRDGKNNEKPFIAGIDATQLHKEYKESLDEQLYASIIEMITLTLEASVGVDVSESSLVSKVDMQNNIIIFMPRVEVIKYEILRERYRRYIKFLQNA